MHDEMYRQLVPRKLGNSPRIQIVKMMSIATPSGRRSKYSKYLAHNTKEHYFYRKKTGQFFNLYCIQGQNSTPSFDQIRKSSVFRTLTAWHLFQHKNLRSCGSGKNMKNRTTATNGVDKTSVHVLLQVYITVTTNAVHKEITHSVSTGHSDYQQPQTSRHK